MSYKLLFQSAFILALPILFIASQGFSEGPTLPATAVSAANLKRDSVEYREVMETISRQLGVTCNTCHNTSNFADAKKLEFRIAKEHIRIVQVLIDSGMNGKGGQPKADCYMCHRGELKPKYKEQIDPLIQKNRRLKPTTNLTPEESDPE